MLALAPQLVSLQLDHYQLLFLLRVAEALGELGAFLASDSARIVAKPTGMVVGAVLPQVDKNFPTFHPQFCLFQVDISVILPAGDQVGDGSSEAEVTLT